MKEEAEKYQKTQKELADKEILEKLFKMYHAEEDIKRAEGELRERQEELNDLVGCKDCPPPVCGLGQR